MSSIYPVTQASGAAVEATIAGATGQIGVPWSMPALQDEAGQRQPRIARVLRQIAAAVSVHYAASLISVMALVPFVGWLLHYVAIAI